MVFTNVVNPRAFIERKPEFRATRVGTGATLGANSTIVCGIDIGAYALVGAGAVVTRDEPAYALGTGGPGRQTGGGCRCGVKLGADLVCGECGARYAETDGALAPT